MPEQPTPPDAPAGDVAPPPYTRPGITLVGNMNDLLAGGGSHETDVQGTCGTGPIIDPSCIE